MTNQNKTNLLETFVRDREYLAETAALHAALGRAVKANVKPTSFLPEVTACAEVLKDGIPLLQQPANLDLTDGVKTVAESVQAWFASLDDASKIDVFRDLLQQGSSAKSRFCHH